LTFYRGREIPTWTNDMFYCNYHQDQLRRVHLAPITLDRIVSEEIVTAGCSTDVETGPDGALYFTDLTTISRIRRNGAAALTPVPAPIRPAVTPTAMPAGTRDADRDVDISLTEFSIKPSRTKVPAGKIRFVAENLGSMVHALRVVGKGVDASSESIRPGDNGELDLTLAPGTYTLSCPIENHTELGMVATITVVGN
jgi:uncharacterized cupredoxin-like copper-binding protein